jgi:phage-related protein
MESFYTAQIEEAIILLHNLLKTSWVASSASFYWWAIALLIERLYL